MLSDTQPALRLLELSTHRLRLEKWQDSVFFRPTGYEVSSWRWVAEVVSRMGPELGSSPSLWASLTHCRWTSWTQDSAAGSSVGELVGFCTINQVQDFLPTGGNQGSTYVWVYELTSMLHFLFCLLAQQAATVCSSRDSTSVQGMSLCSLLLGFLFFFKVYIGV